ncbi:methyl-accepting chemotaxis protein [[Empedobacter] haloabium]|uniref:Methyl-accepting chemotaxis protein n=1 Tax=[Empedobacter] haloabium TaxID=592317 RepID=A0ABZ1UT73_9BURK
MKLANLKIGVRLSLLGAFFLVTLLLVGITGWSALRSMNERNAAGFAEAEQLLRAVDNARMAQVDFKIQVQEWKNMLLRSYDDEHATKYREAFVKAGASTQDKLNKLHKQMTQLQLDTALVDDAVRLQGELQQRYVSAFNEYTVGDPASAKGVDAAVKGMDRPPTEQIDKIVAFIQKAADERMAKVAAQNTSEYERSVFMLLALLVAAVAIGAVIVVMLVRGITVPLARALDIARDVADGDLRAEVRSNRQDEIGDLLRALGTMSGNLARIVTRVRGGTQAIAAASAEIAHGNADLSARTEDMAGSLEETAASMTELTSTVRANSDNASEAARLAGQASSVSGRGSETVAEVVASMGAIGESSGKIAEIIGVIDGIAFQTNILALNAAVEAARAGEQGRGFAVVASEVRNLAQRSSSAAKEIRELITASVAEVGSGRALVDRAGATMREVLTSVEQVTAVVTEISMASTEQQEGIEQIGTAISHIDSVTQQNAALVEQAAAAAESLKQQARELDEAVAIFKLAA